LSNEIVAIGLLIFEWTGIRQSLKGPATGWSVRGFNSMQARDVLCSRPVEIGPGAHAASCAVRGELSYLAPLGSEKISAPYFKQCFFRGGYFPPPPE